MHKKVMFLLFISFSLFGLNVYAHDNPTQKGICYLFNKNKLISKGNCKIESGGGAGGYWVNLSYKNKSYNFEYSSDEDDVSYLRDNKKYNIIKNSQKLTQKQYLQMLDCHKNKPYDICNKILD